jgi:hypothetical protein
MHIRPTVNQEPGDRDMPVRHCLIEWCFLHVIGYVDICAVMGQRLDNLEVAVG